MGFITKFIQGKERKWFWYLSTLGGGALPILISVFVSLDADEIKWLQIYTINDMIFLGLTMNIANLNLFGNKKFNEKEILVIISFLLMIFLAFSLGRISANASEVRETSLLFKIFIHVMVIISVYVSFEINNFVYERLKKRTI